MSLNTRHAPSIQCRKTCLSEIVAAPISSQSKEISQNKIDKSVQGVRFEQMVSFLFGFFYFADFASERLKGIII